MEPIYSMKRAKHKKQNPPPPPPKKRCSPPRGAFSPIQSTVQCVSAANTHPLPGRNLFLFCGFTSTLVLRGSHCGRRACSRHGRAATWYFHFVHGFTSRDGGQGEKCMFPSAGSVRRRLFSICLCIDFIGRAAASAPAGGGLLLKSKCTCEGSER